MNKFEKSLSLCNDIEARLSELKELIMETEQSQDKDDSDHIVKVLQTFGIEISNIEAMVGPTFTLYEITLAQGVRMQKVKSLEDDIAISLAALGVRIIAPIPGKETIGIEVPNNNPSTVSMESILNSKKYKDSTMELPCAIGKTVDNEVFIFDLTKAPHLLVAGACGQGKSVCLNAIITSLIYKKSPSELKFLLIDPKEEAFLFYDQYLNQFLAKLPDEEEHVITDVNKAIHALKSLCDLIDKRYELLKVVGARNIIEYNQAVIDRSILGLEYMPYIVVIIDEFGNLMMDMEKEFCSATDRITQLACSVGVHMVIATQLPTTISGSIQVNFPSRIAFKVHTGIDSKTILGRVGVQQLSGKGDMLYLSGAEPVRVQCAFANTLKVGHLNEFFTSQQSHSLDPLFKDAARLLFIDQIGSTSLIQRKFAIGYNRAARLMEQLEEAGIVSIAEGSKSREVLVSISSYSSMSNCESISL